MPSSVIVAIAACLAFLLISDVQGVRVSRPQKRQNTQAAEFATYDFIIVGGGTAGLALAARLSEIANQSILVVDGGQSPELIANYKVPGAVGGVLGTVIDSAYITNPDPYLNNRQLAYHRARALGGTSTINGLVYGRGSSSLYDNWQALGNSGWSWEDVFPYFKKSTTFNPPVHLNYSYTTYDASAYSDGPITIGYPEFQTASADSFIAAVGAAVGVIPVQDLTLGSNLGIKQSPLTIDTSGQRASCFDTYYQQAKGRTNLNVLTLAPVNLIALEQVSNNEFRADHVVVADETVGRAFNVTARKEIILSGGAHGGPQLLMLSGIGPAATLTKYGIPQYIENENVGQNHQDGVYITINVRVQANASTQRYYNDISLEQAAGAQFKNTKLGPFTNPQGATRGFQKLSQEELQSLAPGLLENRSEQAHVEYIFYNDFYPNQPTPSYAPLTNESYISLSAGLMAPQSLGNVTLQSNSHSDGPSINLNYFTNEEDQRIMVYAFKRLRAILNTPEIQQWTIGPFGGEVSPGPTVQTDDEIIEYIRGASSSAYHACGTCAMKSQDLGGVVDDRLRLYGVPNLRVVDTSVFPIIPDDHPQAFKRKTSPLMFQQGATYMLAEKAAALIKEDWGL